MMRALSKLPEVAGLTPDGHAEGTATLAVQIGRRRGLHPDDVVEVEYAALLHDIGRIVAETPDEDSDERDLARWGAEIIRQAPYLTHVAEQVEAHPMPYRRPGEERDPDLSVNARIVRVASQYDEASRSHEMLPLEALEVGASVPFRVAIEGGKVPVTVRLSETCPTCGGSCWPRPRPG